MARAYPPFSALRAFEATARLGKQSDAATELRISTSAISHQIRALEAYLGIPVFKRSPRGLSLTAAGQSYFERISSALDIISEATADKLSSVDDTPLKLHMYPSLANLWFVPNLRNFSEVFPEQRVTVITMPEHVVLPGSDIDAAIVFSDAEPPSPYVDLLFPEVIVPVCSPRFLEEAGPIDTVEELLTHNLIGSHIDPEEWTQWATLCGHEQAIPARHLSFDNRANALKAAREGLGLAMDRRPSGEIQKSQGHLVAPIAKPVLTGWSYYFVTTERAHSLGRVKKARSWLLALCAPFRDGEHPAQPE
jgi:LysR family glycine cleavage system transcriptional activator